MSKRYLLTVLIGFISIYLPIIDQCAANPNSGWVPVDTRPECVGNCGNNPPIPSNYSWVTTLSAGVLWPHIKDETQTFYLTPTIRKSYVPSSSDNTLGSAEIFIGYQSPFLSQFQGQLGLAAASRGDAKLEGIIWDDGFAQFANHSYEYKVFNISALLKGKLLLCISDMFIPWISGAAGVAFNRAHSFTNTPLIFEAIVNNNFSDKTTTSFTYSLGIGAQYQFSSNWQIGLGYEFSDLGKAGLGRAAEQTLNTGLQLDHFYAHGVMFNLTYIS